MIVVDRNKSNQDKGVWTKFGDSQFKVAHTGSIRFQRILNRLQAPHRRKIEKGTLDPSISRDILCEAMAGGLLLDWKDVINSNKEEVPFSPEMAEMALKNNDDLREFLQEFALDLENFRAEEMEEEGKS